MRDPEAQEQENPATEENNVIKGKYFELYINSIYLFRLSFIDVEKYLSDVLDKMTIKETIAYVGREWFSCSFQVDSVLGFLLKLIIWCLR